MIIDPNTKYMYMTRGDTVAFKADLEDDDGEPKALVEGDTIYFTVKESARTDEIKVQKIITEFVDGVALITLHPNDTKSLDFKRYRYDIQFTSAEGAVKTIIPENPQEKVYLYIGEEITYD